MTYQYDQNRATGRLAQKVTPAAPNPEKNAVTLRTTNAQARQEAGDNSINGSETHSSKSLRPLRPSVQSRICIRIPLCSLRSVGSLAPARLALRALASHLTHPRSSRPIPRSQDQAAIPAKSQKRPVDKTARSPSGPGRSEGMRATHHPNLGIESFEDRAHASRPPEKSRRRHLNLFGDPMAKSPRRSIPRSSST